ncbi:transposase [Streptomyces sp. NPDC008163]|uniref:transposase n=1 Tax=Streptomyces sp. NPDC008163 TaxID=3364818 RepID=UPI0036E4A6D3
MGSSPDAKESAHYVCNGKRQEYAGAATCSCSQIYAQGVEEWVWGNVCALSGNWEQPVHAAAPARVDYSARLVSLTRRIAEQFEIIDLVAGVTAQHASRQGLVGGAAEALVESRLRPLRADLEQLRSESEELSLWQSESQKAEREADSLRASASGGLEKCTKEQQSAWLGLLGITVRVLENPPAMRRGPECPIGDWFRARDRNVPALSDAVWRRIVEAEGFPGGGMVPRQAGGPAPRAVLQIFLEKALTGAPWAAMEAETGFRGLIGHWKRWSGHGRWERVMEVMKHCDGAPPAPRHRIPKMQMTGEVLPGVVLAESGD